MAVPKPTTQIEPVVDFTQTSFSGGMNLILDDTRLAANEYREAFNVRNRFDVLDGIKSSVELYAPIGVKQGIYTFGDYVLLFIAGYAYYCLRGQVGWTRILGFSMSSSAERYWIASVPTATTLFARLMTSADITGAYTNVGVGSGTVVVGGSPSGILVQDNITQPYFIWIDSSGVHARQTQKYSDWKLATLVDGTDDAREYVPIGNMMEWYDGILWMVSQDHSKLYRSVSGRPLDFVVNVDTNGNKGGDAETTAYSVGVAEITCLKAMSSDGLFVSAANRYCYLVSINRTPTAQTMWGEPTFIRKYLFDAGCVNERSIIDILGDIAFVDPEGLRSYNAVMQQQNEGRNSIFSRKISPLFRNILQDGTTACAIVYDNYALFSLNTIYGPQIIVYDTLNQSFCSIDNQANGSMVKQFAKISTDVTELFAITSDDKLIRLYAGTSYALSSCRLRSCCSQNPKQEIQPADLRCVLSGFRQNSTVRCTTFVNNRLSSLPQLKSIPFHAPVRAYTDTPTFSDIDSQVNNLFFNWNGANHGWKVAFMLQWTGGGSITHVQAAMTAVWPKNPILSQQPYTRTSSYVKATPQARFNGSATTPRLTSEFEVPIQPGTGVGIVDEGGTGIGGEGGEIITGEDGLIGPPPSGGGTGSGTVTDEQGNILTDENGKQLGGE